MPNYVNILSQLQLPLLGESTQLSNNGVVYHGKCRLRYM